MDVRLPIGALFTILGVVLASFGAASNEALYERSLGININLEWGLVMLGFGLVMVVLGSHRSFQDVESSPATRKSFETEEEGKLFLPRRGRDSQSNGSAESCFSRPTERPLVYIELLVA